jgi:arylsulfatase A-like enzyme
LIGGDGTVDAPRTTHAGAYEQTQRTFRDGPYKLIEYRPAAFGGKRPASTPGSTMTQLFDLDADPWEMENLAGRPEYAEIEHQLREQLQEWQVTVGDPFRDAYAT